MELSSSGREVHYIDLTTSPGREVLYIDLTTLPGREVHYIDLTTPLDQQEKEASPLLHLPKEACGLLPLDSLSVMSLIDYVKLPKLRCIKQLDIDHWLSTTDPSPEFQPNHLSRAPLPPLKVVINLHKAISNRSLLVSKSITTTHILDDNDRVLPQNLPLWSIQFWKRAHEARSAQSQWKQSMKWMDLHCQVVSTHAARDSVINCLKTLCWTDNLHASVGFGSVLGLTTLLSDKPLLGANIHQLLAVLRDKLRRNKSSNLLTNRIVDLEFGDSLLQTQLDDAPYNHSFQEAEEALLNGSVNTVSGVLHVHGNHYTCFVFDLKNTYLGYGDSMGGAMPQKLQQAFIKWIVRFNRKRAGCSGVKEPELWFRPMPISTQKPGDDYSCGILAVNALEHHHLHSSILLDQAMPIAMERIMKFIDICQLNINEVSFCICDPYQSN